jgi:hypothetical protein
MNAKPSAFTLVKVSAKRFIVAKFDGEIEGAEAIQRYATVTCPLAFKDAVATLVSMRSYGEKAIPRAAKPVQRSRKCGKEGKCRKAEKEAVTLQADPRPIKPRKVAVQGFAAEWD